MAMLSSNLIFYFDEMLFTVCNYLVNETSEGGNALFSVAWSEIDMKLITTSGNHAVSLWNVHNCGTLTNINLFKAHRCSVKTACFKPQNSGKYLFFISLHNIFIISPTYLNIMYN